MYLDKIVAEKQSDPAFRRGKEVDWEAELARAEVPEQRGFSKSLRDSQGPSIIAEMKRADPSGSIWKLCCSETCSSIQHTRKTTNVDFLK